MKTLHRHLLLGTALLATIVVPVLVGCGGSADPFVGTWQMKGHLAIKLVVTKKDNVYWAVLSGYGSPAEQAFSRHGNQLVSQSSPLASQTITVDLDPQSGHLHYGRPVVDYDFTKVSDSTAVPTASP